MRTTIAVLVTAFTMADAGAQMLPWRRLMEERLRQQDKVIAEKDALIRDLLLQLHQAGQGRAQPQPPIIIIGPRQGLPVPGWPKQELPIEGQPKQGLPIEGQPKQGLPIEGQPKQELPTPGVPRQELPPGPAPPGPQPPGPQPPAGPPQALPLEGPQRYTPSVFALGPID